MIRKSKCTTHPHFSLVVYLFLKSVQNIHVHVLFRLCIQLHGIALSPGPLFCMHASGDLCGTTCMCTERYWRQGHSSACSYGKKNKWKCPYISTTSNILNANFDDVSQCEQDERGCMWNNSTGVCLNVLRVCTLVFSACMHSECYDTWFICVCLCTSVCLTRW